jgi:hypothetical protein
MPSPNNHIPSDIECFKIECNSLTLTSQGLFVGAACDLPKQKSLVKQVFEPSNFSEIIISRFNSGTIESAFLSSFCKLGEKKDD